MRRFVVFLSLFLFFISIASATYVISEIYDDFGDPSGTYQIVTERKLTGTYKNSSVSNGKINFTMSMNLDSFDLVFVIEENGMNKDLSTALSTNDIYSVKIKDNLGNIFNYYGQLELGPNFSYNAIRVSIELNDNYRNTLTIPEIGMYCDEVKVVISNNYGTYSLGTINIREALELILDKTPYIEAENFYNKGMYKEAKEKILQLEDNYESYIYYQGEELKTKIYSKLGEYFIGMTVPAGGYIFYDCDADNNDGNPDGYISTQCGWRYIEAAPYDIGDYIFGYYKPDGTSLYAVSTLGALGKGKENTETLVKFMDINGEAYSIYDPNNKTTEEYGAKKCLDYSYGGYDDWFLPSIEELALMYKNLYRHGIGSFTGEYYLSSSERTSQYVNCYYILDSAVFLSRGYPLTVRPIRYF